jgi:hypothetical protein
LATTARWRWEDRAQSERIAARVQTAADLAAFYWPAGPENKQEPAVLSTTDDLRIRQIRELSTPDDVMREIPRTLTATRVVMAARNAIHAILNGTDDRLLLIVGPCSVHDPVATMLLASPPSAND